MADKLYDDERTMALLVAARQVGVDWSEIGPDLAYQLQEARREMHRWMLETRNASQIADTWRERCRLLDNELRRRTDAKTDADHRSS